MILFAKVQKTLQILQPSTHCLFLPPFNYTQRLLKPSDILKTNVYLKQVIRPKPKIELFSFWFFSLGLSVGLCVRAFSRNQKKTS